MAARSRRIDEERCEALHPTIDSHVIDLDTTLDQQLLDIAIRQAIPQIPTHRENDHRWRVPEPLNAEAGTGADLRVRGIVIS